MSFEESIFKTDDSNLTALIINQSELGAADILVDAVELFSDCNLLLEAF